MANPFKIFIAYSRQDSALLEELRKHLRPLQRTGKVRIWYDGLIEPGAVWEEDIKANLHSADLILPLVSADAIDSDYFYEKELTDALARHERGEARVAPLILRPCAWKTTPLKHLQALPKNGKPVTAWDDRDAAWNDAVESIWHYVETRELQRQAEEARRSAEAELQRLEALAQAQREAEAQKRLEEQHRQQQEADQRTKAEKEHQRLQTLENQRLEKERKQQEAEARRLQSGGKGFDWRIPAGVVAVLLLVFVIWKMAGDGGNGELGIPENIAADNTAQEAAPDTSQFNLLTEESAFKQAQKEATIPTWKAFLLKYKHGNREADAILFLKNLEIRVDTLLKVARVYNTWDPETASLKLDSVFMIDPKNKDALDLQRAQ